MDRSLLFASTRCVLAAAFACWLIAGRSFALEVAHSDRPMTVLDTLRTARFQGARSDQSEHNNIRQGHDQPVVYSPDRKRYVTLLVRGIPETGQISAELLSGRVSLIPNQARPRIVASFETSGLGDPDDPSKAYMSLPDHDPLMWLDNRMIAFLWEDSTGTRQVFSIDAVSGEKHQMTSGRESPYIFDATPEGDILYATRLNASPTEPAVLNRRGTVVQSADVFGLIAGKLTNNDLYESKRSQWLFKKAGDQAAKVIDLGNGINRFPFSTVSISPNRQWAIVSGSPIRVPDSWQSYGGLIGRAVAEFQRGPAGSEFYAAQLGQLFLVNLTSLRARPLWDAPAYPTVPGRLIAWSPDDGSIALAASFTPIEGRSKLGREGRAFAVINLETGTYSLLPMPDKPGILYNLREFKWLSPSAIEVVTDSDRFEFGLGADGWRITRQSSRKDVATGPIRVCEGDNSPPKLLLAPQDCAHGTVLLDPNHDLVHRFQLGTAEDVFWNDEHGRNWSGRLYLPASYVAGTRYPLVIQTHGTPASGRFSLYGFGDGPGTGPGTGVYAAQVLAGRGMAVLQLADLQDAATGTPREAPAYVDGYEWAVRYLDAQGLIDPKRVALLGFSRTAWHVQFAITHSPFPFAAAVASDGISGGYVEETLAASGVHDSINGAAPFGPGLLAWLKTAPPFNAEKVTSPLLLIQESGPVAMVIPQWEMFSRLRALKKPVELFIAPDIEHGSHGVVNPAQVLAVSGRVVDWFDFWLNGHEDPDPVKIDQYARWEKLCDLQKLENPSRLISCVPSRSH